MWPNYKFSVPKNKRLRYIIHTDCKNEADDQYTVAHCLMTEKLEVEGIVAAHFEINEDRYPKGESVNASFDETKKIVDLMHLTGDVPIYTGAAYAMSDEQTPIDSEGARFIIQQAMKDDPRPLYIGLQGSITDLASALLMEPRIAEKIIAIWIGGGIYPKGGFEFNLYQDIHAANVVFKSNVQLWQIPMNVYKQFGVSLAELQYKVYPHGQIGRYLFEQMVAFNEFKADDMHWPHGELWGLGDEGCIAALLTETEKTDIYEEIDPPTIAEDMTYIYGENPSTRKIRLYHALDARLDLEDLFAKLAINFPNPED